MTSEPRAPGRTKTLGMKDGGAEGANDLWLHLPANHVCGKKEMGARTNGRGHGVVGIVGDRGGKSSHWNNAQQGGLPEDAENPPCGVSGKSGQRKLCFLRDAAREMDRKLRKKGGFSATEKTKGAKADWSRAVRPLTPDKTISRRFAAKLKKIGPPCEAKK